MLNELYLIVTLCAGTTNFYTSKSSDSVHSYAVMGNHGTAICEKKVYKLSAIETWFCKYFGHRWADKPMNKWQGVIATEALWISERERNRDKMICSLCGIDRSGSWKPVLKTETEWVWEP